MFKKIIDVILSLFGGSKTQAPDGLCVVVVSQDGTQRAVPFKSDRKTGRLSIDEICDLSQD